MGSGKGGDYGNTLGSSSFLDELSLVLLGLTPIGGIPFDIASAIVDTLRGEYFDATLSLLGTIPVIGETATATKLAKASKALKAIDKSQDIKKITNKLTDMNDILAKKISVTSPLKIPKSAKVQMQQKTGYEQIKYTWSKDNYNYTSRWHTRTPNAPITQVNSWVVERKLPGIGYGKNQRVGVHEVLIGKNTWIAKKEWDLAIKARKQGTATKLQKEILDNGHWKEKP